MLWLTNNKDNEVTVIATPVEKQDIDVTGTQDIDQTNKCNDDDLGIPGEIECLNDEIAPEGLGNSFSLAHDQGGRCVSRIIQTRYQSGKYMCLV